VWTWIMDPSRLNVVLNLLGIALGGGALGVILTHWRGIRTLDDAKEAGIRIHWADEVKRLTERADAADRRYVELLEKFDAHREQSEQRYQQAIAYHDQCVAERAELRHELEGLKRQLAAQSTDRVLVMEENCDNIRNAPHSLAAAKRLKDNGNGNGK
jgi:hypothetical protein